MQARAKLAPCLRIPDQELSVWIEGAAAKVTKAYFLAIDTAEGFGIDTSDVDNFDKGAVIEKVVQGPPEFEGKWNLCSVMKAFAPNMYVRPDSVRRALARTSVTEYHSRRELQMKYVNNITMTFIYMHTADIYKLFLKFDVAGVRKHAARLWKGVNVGDSGALGKLVQAGAAVPQPCLALDQQGLMSHQEVSVWIEGAFYKVTKGYFLANDMADVFGIDTSGIPDFNKGAFIENVLQGPPVVQGKWGVLSVMMAFAPNLQSQPANFKRALASVTGYNYTNDIPMTSVYMDNGDICQLFLELDVPGVRKDAGRLWKGVETDDAGVMGELVQAGEAAQQPIADQEMSVVIGATADKAVDTLVPVRQLSMQDHENYTVAEGAPVQEILQGMLGPRCDENRDAFHQLALKLRDLENNDSAKKEMNVELWTFKGDGTTWVNTTSVFKYIYTGSRDNFARMQRSHFQHMNIPHKLLEVPGVRTIFFK